MCGIGEEDFCPRINTDFHGWKIVVVSGGRGIILLSFVVQFQVTAERLLRNQIAALSRQRQG
jgi:hypothetical protein